MFVFLHGHAHVVGKGVFSFILSAGTDDTASGACSYQNVINCYLLNSVVIC